MTSKLSSIVIINLIANLPSVYHKTKEHPDLVLTDPVGR